MTEHLQMRPPDYHQCIDTMFANPSACLELLDRLAAMTEAQARYKWSPWRGQPPPMYGAEIAQHIPAEVRLVAVEAELAGSRRAANAMWRELSEALDMPWGSLSYAELITYLRQSRGGLGSG